MENPELDVIVENRIKICREILIDRAKIYAPNLDRLENFKKAGKIQGISSVAALRGMMSKQIVAMFDGIAEIDKGNIGPSEKGWNNILTDIPNYCFLLEGLLAELGRMKNHGK